MTLPQISYSMRQSFKSCPRKVYFRYVAGIEPIQKDDTKLTIGKAFHLGLESIRQTSCLATGILESANMLDAANFTDEDRVIEHCRMRAYLIGYTNHYDDLKRAWDVEMKMEFDGQVGFIDGVYEGDNGLVLIEDKTRSLLTKNLDTVAFLSEQLITYALMANLSDMDVDHIQIRETQKTKSKPRKGESLDSYSSRILEEYTIDSSKYQSAIVKYTTADLCRFSEEMAGFDAILIKWLGSGKPLYAWPRNSNACVAMYGPCEFMGICSGLGCEGFCSNNKDPLDDGKFRNKFIPTTSDKNIT